MNKPQSANSNNNQKIDRSNQDLIDRDKEI